jgi:predicted metalloprotease
MSDNWNPPPGREPADNDQPAGPPERPAADGQSPKWWTESTEPQREFLSDSRPGAAQPERPQNNWFGDGWTDRRPEAHDHHNPTWQTSPDQSRPTPPATGQSGPQHPGRGQSGAAHPGAGQAGWGSPTQGLSQQAGPQTGSAQGNPAHGNPAHGNPADGNSAQGGSAWGGSSQSRSRQGGAAQQGASPWSNALPVGAQQVRLPQGGQGGPQQGRAQSGGRHAAPPGQQARGGFGVPPGGGQIGPMGQPVQQAPTWQYPPIPIPQPPGSGRRRKQKKVSRGLLIGLVVLAVLVVGSGITLLVRNVGNGASPQATDSPTAAPSESPTASETPSETPTTPAQPAAPTADDIVKTSKLYTVGPIAASKCAEPPYAPINFTAARNYYNVLLPCLNRTWSLAMKKAGVSFRPPKAVVYAGKLSSPCGVQRSIRAAYCAANATIYLPWVVDSKYYKSNPVYARAIMLNTFAHEYGHHVQNLSGILAASITRQQKMTPNQKLVESRRRELQATCLGAAYLGSDAAFIPMRGPLLTNWLFLIAHTGDDYARPRIHDHGNRVSNYNWSIAGFNRKQPNACNTFTAADVRVA